MSLIVIVVVVGGDKLDLDKIDCASNRWKVPSKVSWPIHLTAYASVAANHSSVASEVNRNKI